ncbi:MAG: hypothetical protein BGN98_13790 [Microbacterium sp. 69-7]|uniref:hypothetical protein n=1 Tax=Microbacterium sp. 69-7 TaxID=1895784 RepID=UPI000960AE60|nr:hypothetical protein [Microbacterium sp. 69-7]OJU44452.1 MAG: hypothetical protein BGN98_13790 [Microbacterium sp. 69-7]
MNNYADLIADARVWPRHGVSKGPLINALADAIEALVKERDEQGSCWDEGMTLPVPEGECAPMPPKCELPHGHGGAHRAGRVEWMRRDSYNSVVAERDELQERLAAAEEGLFRVVAAIGEDTDGARTARDYFGPLTVLVRDQPPITDPVGITLHLVSEYRREMEQEADIADARVAEAERERDNLAAVIEKAQIAGQVTGYSHHKEPVMKALSAAPADALREVKAQAWREGWDASERFGYLDGALETPLNPYMEADDDF